jgi:hypothetical protein
MSRIIDAPWSRKRISSKYFEHIISIFFKDKPCWNFGSYLGSMLYIDFGKKTKVHSIKKDEEIYVGECTLGIRNCQWKIIKDKKIIAYSNEMRNFQERLLKEEFFGKTLHEIVFNRKRGNIEFIFFDDLCLSIDITNAYVSEENIMEIRISNGRIFHISPKGYIYLADQLSVSHMHNSLQI